jgi:acyl-homoserine lactone acylase PvdQ
MRFRRSAVAAAVPPDDWMMVGLRRLLETFADMRGVGASGLNFFDAAGVAAGGESGEPGDPWFGNQLGLWLTNEAHPALTTTQDVARDAAATDVLVPGG